MAVKYAWVKSKSKLRTYRNLLRNGLFVASIEQRDGRWHCDAMGREPSFRPEDRAEIVRHLAALNAE